MGLRDWVARIFAEWKLCEPCGILENIGAGFARDPSVFFLVLISSIGHKLVLRTCNAAANLVDVGPDEEGAISDQGATDIQLWFRN